jgi:hypothetical protein
MQNFAYLLIIYRFFVYFLKFFTRMSRFILVIEQAFSDLSDLFVFFILMMYALTIPYMLLSRANNNMFMDGVES